MRVASTALAAVTAAGLAAAVKLLRGRTAALALVLAFSGVLPAVPPVVGDAALVSGLLRARVSARAGSAAPAGRSTS
ncbi:hypothetical protein LZG04_06030 [Saccharothrix sp. S26]|uniref:hypothetical protein n=1 Tax=Saccharothrix sp. S26 TaxID=2907215 RepID=UPI001F1F9701|nr:hypothetical protein [Saccharothrix sp. S26]MCE6994371.1 hypothetical protein [Saccharothrix sp. S26]